MPNDKPVKTIFVLMPFLPEFDDVYLVVRDACADKALSVNVKCGRADEITKPGRITDQIYESIRQADAIVADLTNSNPNVMYELGYAHGLEKPTIILNQSVSESPFDVSTLRQIVYDRNRLVKDCRPRLVISLEEILGTQSPVDVQAISNRLTEEDTSAEGTRSRVDSHVPLTPNNRLVAELQALHIRIRVANSRNDAREVKRSAANVLSIVDRITLSQGYDASDLNNTVAAIGNCAVELESAEAFQEAEDLFKRAIGLYPKFAGVHLQYADFLTDRRRISEAVAELEKARELEPQDPRITQVETKLSLAGGMPGSNIADKLKTEFELDKGNLRKAVEYLQYLNGTDAPVELFESICIDWERAAPEPEKPIARRALADYLATHKLPERARNLYIDLLLVNNGEERRQVLHNLATVCAILNRNEEAEGYWREAYQINSNDPQIKAAFSQALMRQNKLDLAMKVIEGKPLA